MANDPAVLSPAGSRVALAVGSFANQSVLIIDTATGRTVRRVRPTYAEDLYWVRGDGTSRSSPALLLESSLGCGTGACGDEVDVVWTTDKRINLGVEIWDAFYVFAAVRSGVVLARTDSPHAVVIEPAQSYIRLPGMPERPPAVSEQSTFDIAADVASDRLYAITWTGLVATVARASTARPVVGYHRVGLDGSPFHAAWAGQGRIALWGDNGLGMIDTRTWTTRAIAPDIRGVLPTRYGIAGWTDGPHGIAVYRPDGSRRLHLLADQQISNARNLGAYLYADTTTNSRYSIDLRTGHTAGPLATTAQLITPSFTTIP